MLSGGAAATGAAVVAMSPGKSEASAAAAEVAQGSPGSDELSGQVAFVTGAARGIGQAIAVALANTGADIAGVDILEDIPGHAVPLATADDMAATQRLVEQAGRRFLPIQADIRNLAALRSAVDQTTRELGPIEIAIANAGINSNAGFLAEDDALWQGHWEFNTDVNVYGTANTLRAVLPLMAERRSGRVILVSSTFGRQGNASNPAYVASKWAIIGMAKSAAIEVGDFGVTVNAIAPTAVRTGLGGPRSEEERAQGDEWLQANYHHLPIGVLEPEDVAGAAVFLASPSAQYITGATIDVSAGAGARYTA